MKRSYLLIAAAAFGLSLLVPFVVRTDYVLQILFRIYLFAALGLAWNLVGGYTGQLSLGHAAYFGAGAYGLAIFSRHGLPLWLSLICAVLVALLFAWLIDSRRIPYEEAGLWLLMAAGVAGVVGLRLVTRTDSTRRKRQ